MGGVADFVGDAVSSVGGVFEDIGHAVEQVGQAVWEPVEQVGQIAESAVREVGHAVESVGREVGKIGQAAIDDPVGTTLKVAAVASGQWWALPLVSAGLVIANGGDIGQAALAAGISLAAQGVAYGVGEALSAGSSAALEMATADTTNLAAQGLTAGQIAEIVTQSYPEIGASAVSKMVEMAAMGIPAAEIAAEVGSQMAIQNLGASTAANALGGGTRTALSGGDLSDVLSAAGTAGLGTGIGGATSMGLGSAGVGSTVAGAIGKGTGAALASAVSGKDGTSAFLNSLINTSLSEAGAQTKSILKDAWNKVTTTVDEYNKELTAANETQAKIDSLYKTAKEAEVAINGELAAYQPVRDKFSDLVKQYDAAKAAGNTDLANSLADQANAMIPELNAATEKYNSAYDAYEAKVTPYVTEAKNLENAIKKTDALKEEYTKSSEQLTAETAKLSEAAAKVVEMPEPVQHGFAKMYQNGTSVDEALENANTLKGMTTISQETFNRNLGETSDVSKALELANTVNSLDTKQQTAYQTGIVTGLDDSKALEIAPVISDFNSNQQGAYAEAIKRGYGQEGADLISAFASLAPEQTTQAPTTTTPAVQDIASAFTKMSPQEQIKYKEFVNDPSNPMTPSEALQAVSDFFISPASAGTLTPTTSEIQAVYKQTSPGVWSVVGKDSSGKEVTLIPFAQSSGAPFVEGASAGTYTISSDPTKEGGITVVPSAPTGAKMTPEEEAQYQKELAAIDAAQSGTQTIPSTSTGQGTATGPTIPSFDTSSATTPTADFTAPKTTGTSTVSVPTGTTTGTTGAAGTTGTTGGAGVGSPITGGAGVGVGIGLGTTDGTGTGTGGTGTGTGSGTGEGDGFGSGSGSGSGTGAGAGAGTAGTAYSRWLALQGQDQYGGIKNLTPGLTQRMDYTLSGLPTDAGQDTVNPMAEIDNFATGGSTSSNTYDPFSTKDVSGSGLSGSLTPGLSKAQIQYILSGLPGSNISVQGRAEGGEIEGHNPEFFSEGGLGSIDNRYVQGEGDGTSDSVPAMLANGEFVIPADVVAKIGNGSNEAGAGVLDQFLVEIRKHAHSNGEKLPPESKGPLGYLLDAKRKVKA